MDTEQLKTFLEISRTRHFGKAAQNLFISQSAVSARIQALEEHIGAELFIRNRNDIQLTPSGKRLLRHAENILAAWNRAKQDALSEKYNRDSLRIAAMPSLWDIALQQWLHKLHYHYPDLHLHSEVEDSNTIVKRLLEGTLDIGFTFEAPQPAQLITQPIARIPLIMVSSRPNMECRQAINTNYIAVDWGLSFETSYALHFPDAPQAKIHLPLGRMALDYLLECGGSAYIADPMIRDAVNKQQLFLVADAPAFDRSAHAIYPPNTERMETINKAIALFKEI